MTPIEEVRPTQPANWTRRPEARVRRPADAERQGERQRRNNNRSGGKPGEDPGHREHIVDELA